MKMTRRPLNDNFYYLRDRGVLIATPPPCYSTHSFPYHELALVAFGSRLNCTVSLALI